MFKKKPKNGKPISSKGKALGDLLRRKKGVGKTKKGKGTRKDCIRSYPWKNKKRSLIIDLLFHN